MAVLTIGLAFGAEAAPSHPLDALTAEEYPEIKRILGEAGHLGEGTAFAMIQLREPAKADVLAWRTGDPIPRTAFVVLREGPRLFEAEVDLVEGAVASFEEIEGQQSSILLGEWVAAGEVTVADPGWQAAMRARGYDDPTAEGRFFCAPLSAGYFAIPELEGRRLLRVQCFDQEGQSSHAYARPIENLTVVVDTNAGEVVELIDDGVVPVPPPNSNYDVEALGELLEPLHPIQTAQADGPTYEIDGSMVRWGPWSFHVALDRRRGPVISLVSYEDKGEPRSVLYQGSLSEMFVPYMDPANGWYYKTYFDAGEYGFGMFALPLAHGVDCPMHATYLDGVMAFDDGEPVPYAQAICIFEKPTMAPVWRHFEFTRETYEGRPGRELVVRVAAAIGNYDYLFDWVFMPTGMMRIDMAATGLDIVKAVASRSMNADAAEADTAYGTLLAPYLVAPNHDHWFSFRLDFDVDGQTNSFVKDAIVPKQLPGDHPRGSIWVVEREVAATEADARLDISLEHPVQWRFESDARTNAVGNPTGFVVRPVANAWSQLDDGDIAQQRAGFTRHHLWVTPYAPDELYAAGDYPNQSQGGDGLPAWTAADRSIENTDLVAWYTLGFHHIPASEDWPVLPMHAVSVVLKPFNFFDRNPVINAPPMKMVEQAQ
jgi:primary-amine oxidase